MLKVFILIFHFHVNFDEFNKGSISSSAYINIFPFISKVPLTFFFHFVTLFILYKLSYIFTRINVFFFFKYKLTFPFFCIALFIFLIHARKINGKVNKKVRFTLHDVDKCSLKN